MKVRDFDNDEYGVRVSERASERASVWGIASESG